MNIGKVTGQGRISPVAGSGPGACFSLRGLEQHLEESYYLRAGRLQRFKSFPVILNQGGRGCRLASGFFLGPGLGIADFR